MAAKWEHGVPVKTHLAVSGVYSLQQPIFGDIVYRLLLAGDASIDIDAGKAAERQSMTIVIQQPLDGGCEVAWPSGVKWQEGRAPFVDSRPAAITVATFTRIDDSDLLFGRVGF